MANDADLGEILNQLSQGKLTPSESETMIRRRFESDSSSASSKIESTLSPSELLKSFAEIDHTRSSRTGFPEAVFGAGKTPNQIAMILDDMARHFNEEVAQREGSIENCERAILATR
jgi:NCAIR mutase (PurE)-related protein